MYHLLSVHIYIHLTVPAIQVSLNGLLKSFEHEWSGYFCPLNIDAYCASEQCKLLASVVTVKWPGISA